MSLWDFVAAASTGMQLSDKTSKDQKSFWKKFNSASVDLVNGDGLAFTNEGGYTWNIFGANVNFVCDLEALLEGALASSKKLDNTGGHIGLGLLFGPGANNTITIGNTLTLNYMVGHSNNFTVMRGNPEISIKYFHGHLESDVGEGYISDPSKTSRLMWVFIAAFALLIAGFDIALNVLKNQINGEEEKVHKDQAEIEKHKAMVEAEQKDAEARGQVINPDAGGVAVGPTHEQEELEHAKHQEHTDEGTLRKTEIWYESIIFSSIIAENRGIFLLKFLEQLCAGVKTVENELKDLTNTVAKLAPAPDAIDEDNKASVEQEIKNIEKIILQIVTVAALPQLSGELMQNLETQKMRANNVKEELKKKIEDYEEAAKMAELAAWIESLAVL